MFVASVVAVILGAITLNTEATYFSDANCAAYSSHVSTPCNFNAANLNYNWYLVQRFDVGLEQHSTCGRVEMHVYQNGSGYLYDRRLHNNVTEVVRGEFVPRTKPGDYTIDRKIYNSSAAGNAIYRVTYASSNLVISWQCYNSTRGPGSEQDVWVFTRDGNYDLSQRGVVYANLIENGLDYWSLKDNPYDPYKCSALNLASGPTIIN